MRSKSSVSGAWHKNRLLVIVIAAFLAIETCTNADVQAGVLFPNRNPGHGKLSLLPLKGKVSEGGSRVFIRRSLRGIPRQVSAPCSSSAYTDGHWQQAPCGISINLGFGADYTIKRTDECTVGNQGDGIQNRCKASTCDWILSGACSLLRFQRDDFCRALAGRSIYFVGDSITQLQFNSLSHMIGSTGLQRISGKVHWQEFSLCNNRSTVLTVRNDVLAIIPADRWEIRPNRPFSIRWQLPSHAKVAVDTKTTFPWIDLLKNFEVLVLNTGMHLKDRNDSVFEEALTVTFAYLQEHYHGQIYYRLTTRGHPQCQNASESPVPDYADYLARHPDDHPEYGWARVPTINAIERKLAAKFGITVLDVVAMTEMRPDSHVIGSRHDCLHYKLPSVVDSWNWLLYNAIAGRIL
eukprot:jgi/Mesvir1/4842/Mv25255-RA.1